MVMATSRLLVYQISSVRLQSRLMEQIYLAQIEQLIAQNQSLKSTNRKITSLCQDILDDIVDIFTQFFPSILPYDSDCIFRAGEQICAYYRKELLIVRTELCKSLLQVLNLYGLQVDDDLETVSLDNLREFVGAMKSGKGSLIDELTYCHSQIEQLEALKYEMEKAVNGKQLQIKRLCIDMVEKQSQIHRLSSSNELLTMDVANMTKQLARANDECQTIESELTSAEAQLNLAKINNQDLRRQVLYLEKEIMDRKFVQDQRQSK